MERPGSKPARAATRPAAAEPPVLLGVDIGTSATKAVAFDASGAVRGSATRGYPLIGSAPGEAVQDPEVLLAAAIATIHEAPPDGAQVLGIGFSSAMHSLLALDGEGRPLTPLYTWADTRAAAQAERLRAEHPGLHARTGTPLHPSSPLCKLVWLAERQPALVSRARRWVGIKELLLARLGGELAIDESCASGTGLMDLERRRWDPEALALAGLEEDQLSLIAPGTQALALSASAAPGLGLPAGTPLVLGAGDGPLANLGVGAVRPAVAACSIGTSGALRLIVGHPGIDPAGRLFCYALTGNRWAVGGAINNGGSVLDWLGHALAPDLGARPAHALLDLAARVPVGSEGLIMLPYLLSERAPHWSALPRGAYVGLTHAHGRGHLVRAAIEGVCQQLALVLGSIRDAGHTVEEVRATGGFARSELWRQMLTDVLDIPVGFPVASEGSALGAALLAMRALGVADPDERELVPLAERRAPDPAAAAVYAATRPIFTRLYDELTPAFRALRDTGGPR